jgi:hypothetical protein
MPKTKRRRKRALPNRKDGLSLRPLTFEEAVRLALSTPLPENERRKRRTKA